jgi:hypothetical protein
MLAILIGVMTASAAGQGGQTQWYRGNTHTHTLWSDGDGAPELVAEWYHSHGYHFLVLSDHNVLSEGETWFPVEKGGRLTSERVKDLERRFGPEWVELRRPEGGPLQMRLKTLDELRARFEAPGEFLFIQGEEITDEFEKTPVHVNGLNLDELIPPQGGTSIVDTIQRNVDAVIAQSRRLGRPTLAHVNHPNYGWALRPEHIAAIEGERFFEVYNGHPGVHNHGDADHMSTETMWDIAQVVRLHYHTRAVGKVNPGRGWVMVRAPRLEADAIIEAMRGGDFYASSGVTLADFGHDARRMHVSIETEPDVDYRTLFIGTRLVEEKPATIGEILYETTANPAVYEFRGDELYVRAVVISSRLHPNPHARGDLEQAWVQPVEGGAR